MKILLGFDDSPHSEAALHFIETMTWPAGTRVLIVSAVRPEVGAFSEVFATTGSHMDELWEEQVRRHEEIAARAEQVLRKVGFTTEARVVHGDPRVSLVDLARAEKADLMVLGSHGRTGLGKLVMGSVASHVVTHAPCNVLVVKLPTS